MNQTIKARIIDQFGLDEISQEQIPPEFITYLNNHLKNLDYRYDPDFVKNYDQRILIWVMINMLEENSNIYGLLLSNLRDREGLLNNVSRKDPYWLLDPYKGNLFMRED